MAGNTFFISRFKKILQILHLHSTVPSIVKKDFRSPSLHYGWHSQLKLIFSKQKKDQNYKTKIHDMTDYRTTEPRQIAGQGKGKIFFLFSSFSFFSLLGNTNIAALPGGRVFSYYFWSANRSAFNFFLMHLRVEASRISTGISFHNFKAEYLKPFFAHSVFSLGIWRSWQFLVSYCKWTDLNSNLSQRLSGLNLFIILYLITSRSKEIKLLTFSQSQDQLPFTLAVSNYQLDSIQQSLESFDFSLWKTSPDYICVAKMTFHNSIINTT